MIEILYITFVGLSVVACLPQVYKLVRNKSSQDFELVTWTVWLLAQLVTLIYVASLQQTLLVIVNVLWVSFYAVMVGLIVYFRMRPGVLATVVSCHDESTANSR